MCVHFDKSETSVRLETRLGDESKVLEEWNEIILSRVRGEVADIACCLPLRSLSNNHLVAVHPMSGKMVVPIRSGRGHAH